MTTVIVSGAIANKHRLGGEAWVRLSWILGFKQLGCRVYFVEQIDRQTCVDAAGAPAEFQSSANAQYFRDVVSGFGLADGSSLLYQGGSESIGLSYAELLDIAENADLLVNISGHLRLAPLLRRVRCRAYVDIDPGFTQFWHAARTGGFTLRDHDVYFTIGENIGSTTCPIPTDDIQWRPTRQPIVLTDWPVVQQSHPIRFTTVANWRGPFGPIRFGDKTFGLKVHEFRKFMELPRHSTQTFELALDIHPSDDRDLRSLHAHGWHLVDPRSVAGDPWSFREYVQSSGAEFSVAQGIYVDTSSGWFSDRTVRYLASGKPALVQDTGFSRNYLVGEGLIPFRTFQDAVRGAERIARDYPQHCAAARSVTEEYFDSNKVLSRFLDEARR